MLSAIKPLVIRFHALNRSNKLVVERRKALSHSQAAQETGYQGTATNNTLSVLLSTILALQENKEARSSEHALEDFLTTVLNATPPNKLTKEKILYLLNGNSNKELNAGAQTLVDCSDPIIRCLHEHVIKNTAKSMDLSDLREYIYHAQRIQYPGNIKQLESVLKNSTNEKMVMDFTKRLKEIALI